ncbi:MAG: EamA family transporter [Caldisericia bacterium]|nr:EamA family transporter [Caldisericia bacterium]
MLYFLALLGRILLIGFERIVIKNLTDKENNIAVTFIFFLLSLPFLFPFLFFDQNKENFSFLINVLISSIIYTNSFIFYVKSISIEEVSLVTPLYNFNVFFLIILTSIFLNEKITLIKILGLSLLVYGSSFLLKKENFLESLKALLKNKGAKFMILSSMLIGIGRTIDGFSAKTGVSPILYSFFLYLFITIFLFFILLFQRNLSQSYNLIKNKTYLSIFAGLTNAYSYLLLLFAFRKIDVSIAEPSTMLGTIVTLYFSKILFKEDIKYRFIGVLIMILGAYLIFLKI